MPQTDQSARRAHGSARRKDWARLMEEVSTISPAVELKRVVKRFGALTAIDGMDLTVNRGEFFTLLGASGCGKTTTLRLMAGFELPTEGQVLIGGQDVSDIPAHHRPVHTVFQNYALFPHMTVAENVVFPLSMHRVPRAEQAERANRLLSLVKMEHLSDRKPSQLSGGQQQRVALARALVNEPEVLLLDEPLGALDLKLRREMQLELKDIQKRLGITFIFVTHDQEEALTMSDRIALMHEGQIEQLSTPAELYNEPLSCYAAEFIGETNLLQGRVVRNEAEGLVVSVLGREILLPGHSAQTDSEVTLGLRPERVKRNTSQDGLTATLSDLHFVGSDLRLEYMTEGQQKIVVRTYNNGAGIPEIGRIDALHFETGDLRLLKK